MINIGRRFMSRSLEGQSNDVSAEMASSEVNGGGTTQEIGLLSSNGEACETSGSQVLEQRITISPSAGTAPSEMASSEVNGGGTTQEIGLLSSNGEARGTSGSQVLEQRITISPSAGTAPSGGTSSSASLPLTSRCCAPCKLSWTSLAPNNDKSKYSGPDRFKLRELSDAENYHLQKAGSDPSLKALSFTTVFRSPHDRLKMWPLYFEKTKESGEELRDGYVTLWSTLIVAETLLASVAIQPFVSNGGNLSGWRFEVYGLVWMLALISQFMGLSVTILFLGYLFGNPGRVTYMWVCNVGVWIGVPVLLLLVGTFASLIAVGFSSWVIYGPRLGIICIIVEMLVVGFAVLASNSLGQAGVAVEAID